MTPCGDVHITFSRIIIPSAFPTALRYHVIIMIQCDNCEYCHRSEAGEISFSCDPFRNIKEPECLQKWQLLKINQMVASYQATLDHYRKLAPMQEKMFKVMENELDGMNESEKWKIADEDEDDDDKNHPYDDDSWKPDDDSQGGLL